MTTSPSRAGTGPGARVLDRYQLEAPLPPRLGCEAWLAEDGERGARAEVHLLTATPAREVAFPQVRQAIERLAQVPGRALARPLQLEWDDAGHLVLALEYHDGRSLATLLAHRPARPDEGREILRGILHALVLAARVGLHHERLTPARVLLGAENQVALLDLGLAPLLEPAAEDQPWSAPGEARGLRGDAYAVAVIGLELLTGQRPQRGQPLPATPPGAVEAVGAPLVDALARLARADGSAQVFDPGALLALLPARRTRARRSRYTLSEVWDGDIGGGTARLLALALSPEYQDRMPEEIRGRAADSAPDPASDELQFLSTLPGVFLTPPAPAAPDPPPAPPPVVAPGPTISDDLTLPPAAPQVKTVVLPRPTPAPAPPSAPVDRGELETVNEPPPQQSGLTTLAPSLAPAPLPARPAGPPPPTVPLLLRAAPTREAVFLVAAPGQVRLGRERGNELVLRAFKGVEVDGVGSNRISRRHLTLLHAAGAFLVRDEKSTYGTTLDGRRLGPGQDTPLAAGDFGLRLGEGVLDLRGRAWPASGAIRLLRADDTGHQYVALLGAPGTVVRMGSGADDDALLLPGQAGIVPGHALLRVDPRTGGFQIARGEGPVRAGGQLLPPGTWSDLIGVELGGVRLVARSLSLPYDFFSPAAGLSL